MRRCSATRVLAVAAAFLFAGWALLEPAAALAANKRLEGVVNLNTASVDTLVLLPGLGPAKVEAILLYRRKHSFRTVEELGRVKGIGIRMVRELRPHLAVAGPTTAALVHVKTDWEALRRLEAPADADAKQPAAGGKQTGAAAATPPAAASLVKPRPALKPVVPGDRRPRPGPQRWRRPAAVACLGPP